MNFENLAEIKTFTPANPGWNARLNNGQLFPVAGWVLASEPEDPESFGVYGVAAFYDACLDVCEFISDFDRYIFSQVAA